MSSERASAHPDDPLKAYLSDMSSFGLLNRRQEVEAFLRLYGEEDAYLRHLVSRPGVALPVITAAYARMKAADEPDVDGMAALRSVIGHLRGGRRRQAADGFVRGARLSDAVRGLQEAVLEFGRDEDGVRHDAAHRRWLRRADVLAGRVLAVKNHIATCNLRLVVMWARRYRGARRKLDMSDLIQEGNIGLLKAIDKFDVSRANRFSTYASWWIRQSIRRAVSDTSETIRIPVHMLEKLNRLARTEAQHFAKTGEEIGRDGRASQIGTKPEVVDALRMARAGVLSLDAPVGLEYEGSFLDMLEAPDDGPERGVGVKELQEDLDRVMERLTPVELYVIRRRFGLDGGRPQTLSQIAGKYGLSRERIRQLEARALGKMRTSNGALARHLPPR